ncbi:cupin domain-containing protein [Sphingomonas crocodyli]|uniref:ChrR-like cupin domain-containing protein n=1 Tax=Sphingomonas crocodyli TaxID=1979270 RepID=A0A437M054_9SPHN|nr:cupin domain-containing protein [Sphingomonas crocodyli]RVT90956.1 hypothetical protein EOD43_15595 [Sphingomonas crocodyli]
MRPQVDFMDTNALPWVSPKPGLMRKVLSRDEETTAQTVITRLIQPEGGGPPSVPHCHETTEEIMVLDGQLTFDSRCWLAKGGYVYHPPRWIHGYKSSQTPVATFLWRSGADLDFTFFEAPADDFLHHRYGETAGRQAVVVPSPWATRWDELPSAEGRIRQFTYAQDPSSIEHSVLRRYAPGAWDAEPASDVLETREEFYIYEGMVEDQDGRRFSEGWYACLMPGALRPRFRAIVDSIIYHHISAERA